MDRFSLELPAWISVINESKKLRTFEVITGNICAGGAFLRTDQPLSVGTIIAMKLIINLGNNPKMQNQRSRIDVSGSVIRTESKGMAVCFDKRYHISPVVG
jgi:hypothetical protein